MFKRAFWLLLGTVVGFTGSFWLSRWARRQVERVLPERVVRKATTGARRLRRDLRAVAAEAREAMKEREEALRAEFGRLSPPQR